MYLQQEKLLFVKKEAKRFPASELLHPIGWGFSHRDRSLSSIVNEPMHNEKRDFYGRGENFSYSRPELLSPLLHPWIFHLLLCVGCPCANYKTFVKCSRSFSAYNQIVIILENFLQKTFILRILWKDFHLNILISKGFFRFNCKVLKLWCSAYHCQKDFLVIT